MSDITRRSDRYISRELSWLDFNARVLDEAGCEANPLLERLKFIAIFSSNLDEFFMVRIAGLRQLVQIGENEPDAAGIRPSEQLELLRRRLDKLLIRQTLLLRDEILPGLEKHGIRLRRPAELPERSRREMTLFFRSQILPVLTPLAVDPSHPFPILASGSIEIAVGMTPPGGDGTVYAFVEVPEVLPRFLAAADGLPGRAFVLLEELIMDNLGELFTGCELKAFFPFRITRDMDFSVEEDGVEDLMIQIEKKLLQRRQREPIRLEMPKHAAGKLADWLCGEFQLAPQFRYAVEAPLHLKQFFELVAKAANPELLEPVWPPLTPPEFAEPGSIFEQIELHQPILIAPPFHAFDPVVRLLEAAAEDPDVLAIKQTLYRVSGNSPVVRALRRAAENGKQVTVIVELKARFDEGNNILWARRLEESGAHVVYGVSNLKIHGKALLVIRREAGLIRRYLHLATGNYNDKTAALYTDMGIMTCDPDLCFDAANLFNVMTGYSAPPSAWRKIAAAPFDMRGRMIELIDREARNSSAERPGRIIAKMNSLADTEIVAHLHAAAARHVEIDLIVRGICCLKPGPGETRIRVTSIIDRFLEHTRLFYFQNEGNEEYYLSSADWMFRNLDRRIEIFFPIEDANLRKILRDILEIQLQDTEKGRHLSGSGRYSRRLPAAHTAMRSQYRTYLYFKNLCAVHGKADGILKVFSAPEADSGVQ
jgi:polyphosphate kinase